MGLVGVVGGIALDGGDGELTIGEQAHYLGHQDALKSACRFENLAFWASVPEGAAKVNAALATVGLDGLARLPAVYLSAGQRRACRSRGSLRSRGRSGCSTSRPPASTPPARRCWRI